MFEVITDLEPYEGLEMEKVEGVVKERRIKVDKERREHERREPCSSCNGEVYGYCDEHKMAIAQLEENKGMAASVNQIKGILGLIGTLIALLIGLLFNAHFENQKSMEVHSEKFNALSSQISKLENDNDKALSNMRTEVLKLSITLDQNEKHREKDNETRNKQKN